MQILTPQLHKDDNYKAIPPSATEFQKPYEYYRPLLISETTELFLHSQVKHKAENKKNISTFATLLYGFSSPWLLIKPSPLEANQIAQPMLSSNTESSG